jgi:carbamoyl-phosphate synthase large subunit
MLCGKRETSIDKSMNILLTCVGRQSQLVRRFKLALAGRGELFVSASNADAPGLKEADHACILPSSQHSDYLDALLELCAERQIRLLVPLSLTELPLLAQNHARFLNVGTLALVSSKAVTHICCDRMATDEFLREWEIASPKSYPSLSSAQEALCNGDLQFPVTLQSRWGGTQMSLETAQDHEEMELAAHLLEKRIRRAKLPGGYSLCLDYSVLIQKKLTGHEYGLGIVNDLQGNYVSTFVKRHLNSLAGQTERAITEVNPRLEEIGMLIGQKLRHIGCLHCQVLVTPSHAYVLSLTPLIDLEYLYFSEAGADIPSALIAWVKCEKVNPKWLQVEPNVMMAYDDHLEVLGRQRPLKRDGKFLLVKP